MNCPQPKNFVVFTIYLYHRSTLSPIFLVLWLQGAICSQDNVLVFQFSGQKSFVLSMLNVYFQNNSGVHMPIEVGGAVVYYTKMDFIFWRVSNSANLQTNNNKNLWTYNFNQWKVLTVNSIFQSQRIKFIYSEKTIQIWKYIS